MRATSSINGVVTALEMLSLHGEVSPYQAMQARVEKMARQLNLEVVEHHEAVLEGFVISGAFPRDLAIETGRPTVEWRRDPGTDAIKLRVAMPWRVK